jgi:hypothetical protein
VKPKPDDDEGTDATMSKAHFSDNPPEFNYTGLPENIDTTGTEKTTSLLSLPTKKEERIKK